MRLTFGLVALFEALSVVLIFRLINELKRPEATYSVDPAIVGAGLWALVLSNLIHNAIGLETGLYAMMILLSSYLYARIIRRAGTNKVGIGSYAVLGIVLGLTVLARIDAVFLVGAMLAYDVFARTSRPFGSRLLRATVAGIVAILVSSPWWIYNYTTFGSLMPISGQSESIGSMLTTNISFSSTVLANICFVLFYVPTEFPPGPIATIVALLVLGIVATVKWRTSLVRKLSDLYILTPITVLVLFSGLIVLYYTFVFSAPHFIGRYFHPVRVTALLTAALVVPMIVSYLKTAHTPVWKRYALYLYVLIAIGFNATHYLYNFTIKETSPLYWAGLWAKEHPQYRLGMTSSGTANFVSGSVVNLDGKVNFDALRARRNGTMGKYIVRSGINVILDMDRPSIDEATREGAVFVPIDTFKNSIYYLKQ